MKSKKLVSILLTLAMVISLMPAAMATGETDVAQVGETKYTSLAEAVDAAEAANATVDEYGDLPEAAKVVLLKDTTISELIKIEKPVKIDLAGNTLTCTAKKAFEVYADAIFVGGTKDTNSGEVQGKILNTHASGRCIDTRTKVLLKVQGITLETTGASNPQPLTIGGTTHETVVNVWNTTIDAGKSGYGIIAFVESALTIEASSVSGYAALYMKDGSAGSTVNVCGTGSTLSGINKTTYHESNSFGTIVLEEDNISLSVNGGNSIVAEDENGSGQVLLALGSIPTGSVTGTSVTLFDGVTLTTTGDATGYLYAGSLSGNTVMIPSGYVDELEAEGYTVESNVVTSYSAPINTEAALKAAVAAGGTVTLDDDITLTETLTIPAGKTVTLDLNGKTISQTKEQTTGYQMILNDGNLTIKDSSAVAPSTVGTGKISYTDSGAGGEYVSNTITNRGTLTIKSGTVENLSLFGNDGYPYAIDTSIHGAAAEVNTVVEGGKVYCKTYSGMRLMASSETEPVNMTVSGGEIDGRIEVQNPTSNKATLGTLTISGENTIVKKGTRPLAIMVFGAGGTAEKLTVEITGGTFTGRIDYSANFPISGFNEKVISGGTFDEEPSKFLAEGYTATLTDGKYVVADNREAQNTTTGEKYTTLADAIADAASGNTIKLLKNVTINTSLNINDALTIDGGNHTLTWNGSYGAYPFEITTVAGEVVTIQNLVVAASASERGINCNTLGTLNLDNVNMTAGNYTLNLRGATSNGIVNISDSEITGLIPLNIWGKDMQINLTDTEVTSEDNNAAENYTAIVLNNNGTTAADGTVVTVTGGKIIAKDENQQPSVAVRNNSTTGVVNISNTTEVIGEQLVYVAIVTYTGAEQFYSEYTLQDAINKFAADKAAQVNVAEVKLLRNNSENVTVDGNVTMNLNGKTMTGTITLADAESTLTAASGLNVVSKLTGYNVVYADGTYSLVQGEVTGVSLNKSTLSLKTGRSETLTATVLPADAANKAVTWTSSNPSVATVDSNGKVTAVAVGSATITVTTEDGALTATCTVTVTRPSSGGTSTPSTPTVTPTTPSVTPSTPSTAPTVDSSTSTNTDGSSTTTETKADGTTVETTTNTDGSTTKTETQTDGTVIETETKSDGSSTTTASKSEVKENKDGSTTTTTTTTNTTTDAAGNTKTEQTVEEKVETENGSKTTTTTETTAANGTTTKSETVAETVKNEDGTETTVTKNETTSSDGSKSTTTVDETGVSTTEVTVTYAAVNNAEKEEAPVALPMPEVTAGETTETAPTVEVNVPSRGATVEIPVTEVTGGTVAVIVHADGTEEVVRTSTVSENGVVVALEGDATIKIVDNSKDFTDVKEGSTFDEAIDFASSRELLRGTTSETFNPNGTTTHGHVATALARLAGEDAPKIKDGVAWAEENEISTGAPSNETITRQDLALMLWRYAGCPESDHEGDITDLHEVDEHAEMAMRWALEQGILKGYGDKSVRPQNTASRAHLAAMMMRYCKALNG